MVPTIEDACIFTKLRIRPESKSAFTDWQARFHAAIAAFPGFVSLEILSLEKPEICAWNLVERFANSDKITAWRLSETRLKLIDELKPLLIDDAKNALTEVHPDKFKEQEYVTEVFITEVSPDKVKAFREWIAKMHQVESKFPGFRGVYVQSPSSGNKNWITFLQFDHSENLDRWLASPERHEVMQESGSLIKSLESHRVISPFAGWFASIAKEGEAPAVWKQTMIVLLVLYPIVMLELRFLNPLLTALNPSLGTFIGNAISVSLVSWPMVPIAIWFLGWWLSPPHERRLRNTIVGTLVVFLLYAIEIAAFWRLLG